jgi:hypothetical protein
MIFHERDKRETRNDARPLREPKARSQPHPCAHTRGDRRAEIRDTGKIFKSVAGFFAEDAVIDEQEGDRTDIFRPSDAILVQHQIAQQRPAFGCEIDGALDQFASGEVPRGADQAALTGQLGRPAKGLSDKREAFDSKAAIQFGDAL